jgi:hypothetical protein
MEENDVKRIRVAVAVLRMTSLPVVGVLTAAASMALFGYWLSILS